MKKSCDTEKWILLLLKKITFSYINFFTNRTKYKYLKENFKILSLARKSSSNYHLSNFPSSFFLDQTWNDDHRMDPRPIEFFN